MTLIYISEDSLRFIGNIQNHYRDFKNLFKTQKV